MSEVCAIYSRARSIWGRSLFKGAVYLRAQSIQGRCLFEGAVYSRARINRENTLKNYMAYCDSLLL